MTPEERLDRIERKLDAIITHLGIAHFEVCGRDVCVDLFLEDDRSMGDCPMKTFYNERDLE